MLPDTTASSTLIKEGVGVANPTEPNRISSLYGPVNLLKVIKPAYKFHLVILHVAGHKFKFLDV